MWRAERAAGAIALAVAMTCGCTPRDEDLLSSAGGGGTASFTPDQSAACPQVDALSLQPGPASGTVVTVNVTLSDCDGSIQLNGLNVELSFDDSIIDFVGCSRGTLFPQNQIVPGTPECMASSNEVLGTIALAPPNSVRVTGGTSDILRLTFKVRRKGVASRILFQRADLLNGSSMFLADQSTQSVSVIALGTSVYSGGTFVSH